MDGINKMNKSDAYIILNIDSNEILTELLLKQKYRKACLKYHPDKPGGDSELFIKVKEAYEYLKNEVVEPLHYYIQMLKNFNYSLVDSFIIEPIVNYLKRTTYELNPTLSHLMNKSVYHLVEHDIYIPLWHQEICFKNIIININPILPDNIMIDADNNIHIIITSSTPDDFILGGISFSIQHCIKNIDELKGKGIPRINIKNIYDYTIISDIILHIRP
jgi:hypothetical protein